MLCVGCKSVDSDTSAQAGVVIRGNTPGQINRAVEQVFAKHGYKLVQSEPTSSTLERKASAATNFAYGNWMGTPVTIRVRTRIVPVGEAAFRLECTAVRVRDSGSTVEEVLPGHPKSGQFKEMLEEVHTSLTGEKPGSA